MAYENRKLIRKQVAMLRANSEEQAELDWLVETYGDGGAPAEVYRAALLEFIRAKRHESNSFIPRRVDTNAFGVLHAA